MKTKKPEAKRKRKGTQTAEGKIGSALAAVRDLSERMRKVESDVAVQHARLNRVRESVQALEGARVDANHQWRWSLRGRAALLGRDLGAALRRAVAPTPPVPPRSTPTEPISESMKSALRVGLVATAASFIGGEFLRRTKTAVSP